MTDHSVPDARDANLRVRAFVNAYAKMGELLRLARNHMRHADFCGAEWAQTEPSAYCICGTTEAIVRVDAALASSAPAYGHPFVSKYDAEAAQFSGQCLTCGRTADAHTEASAKPCDHPYETGPTGSDACIYCGKIGSYAHTEEFYRKYGAPAKTEDFDD